MIEVVSRYKDGTNDNVVATVADMADLCELALGLAGEGYEYDVKLSIENGQLVLTEPKGA